MTAESHRKELHKLANLSNEQFELMAKSLAQSLSSAASSAQVRELSESKVDKQDLDLILKQLVKQETLVRSSVGDIEELRHGLSKVSKTYHPDPLTSLWSAVGAIEQRGNIQVSKVNGTSGHIKLLRPLEFHLRTTKDQPTALFADPVMAESICNDLVQILYIFNCPMTIEGNTKGGEGEFWQTLANNRASAVAETMIKFGASPSLLRTRGVPGRLGKNEPLVEVYVDMRNIGAFQREHDFHSAAAPCFATTHHASLGSAPLLPTLPQMPSPDKKRVHHLAGRLWTNDYAPLGHCNSASAVTTSELTMTPQDVKYLSASG